MGSIVMLPLELWMPTIVGFSSLFIIFGILGIYTLLILPGILAKTWAHPVFLMVYALLLLSILVESTQPHSSYDEIERIGLMIAGAVVTASLCRDERALRIGLYSCLTMGLGMSVYVFLVSYSALQGATATDFIEASQIRAEVFEDNPLQASLNHLPFFTAQGAGVALALALMSSSSLYRYLFFGVTLFCFIASFLPLSRGGALIVIISCVTVIFVYGIAYGGKYFDRFIRAIVLAIALGVCMLIWVPDVIFSRLTFSTQAHDGIVEGRARVYTAAFEHFHEYVITGVGAGNFWRQWGPGSGFGDSRAHNCFIQVTIYWGLTGLLALIGAVYQAYRCLPKRCGTHVLSLGLLGVVASLFVLMMVQDSLYYKGFSLGFGMLVGARLWIWPKGEIPSTSRGRVPLRACVRYMA